MVTRRFRGELHRRRCLVWYSIQEAAARCRQVGNANVATELMKNAGYELNVTAVDVSLREIVKPLAQTDARAGQFG